MKLIVWTFLFLLSLPFIFAVACDSRQTKALQASAVEESSELPPELPDQSIQRNEQWLPHELSKCLSFAKPNDGIEPIWEFNPVYLRLDLDGNKLIDYAILVRQTNSTRNGVLICRDGKEVNILGAISSADRQLSSFEDDNFISDRWSVLNLVETTKSALTINGEPLMKNKAKAEAIVFYHEGGSVFIFWDGKTIRLVEGG